MNKLETKYFMNTSIICAALAIVCIITGLFYENWLIVGAGAYSQVMSGVNAIEFFKRREGNAN